MLSHRCVGRKERGMRGVGERERNMDSSVGLSCASSFFFYRLVNLVKVVFFFVKNILPFEIKLWNVINVSFNYCATDMKTSNSSMRHYLFEF